MRHTQPLVSLLVLCGAISLAGAIETNATETSQPQIVRVSYVQGEVKVSTGIKGSPDLGKDWIAAGVNLPIEEGATLATENGRAEVEFENGSMAYLAEHSVLQFNTLTSNSQGTTTSVTLLMGRATFAHESSGHDELTVDAGVADVHTIATNALPTKILRVESALDGAVVHVVEGSLQISEGAPARTVKLGPGDAFQVVNGVLSPVEGLQDDPDQRAWDQWVSEERAARKADIEEGLKQSGLAAPIPGLVDLVREGTFTDCPPYGKCWEPREASGVLQEQGQAKATPEPRAQGGAGQGSADASKAQSANVRYVRVREDEGTFYWGGGPCGWGPWAQGRHWVDKLLKITPEHPEGVVVQKHYGEDYFGSPAGASFGYYSGWWRRYPWATCYAGNWFSERTELGSGCASGKRGKSGKCQPPKKKWVVGPKRKGGSFVRVRMGKKVGFIPKHPLDVKGKPPLNVKDGVLMFHEKGGQGVMKIKAPPKDLRIVDNLPPGREANWAKNLPKVEKPVIEGWLLKGGLGSERLNALQNANQKGQLSIRYDYKAGDFAVFGNRAASSRGDARPLVLAYLGASQGIGSGSRWGSSGGNSGSGGGWRGSGSSGGHSGGGGSGTGSHGGGGGSSRGSSQSSSHGNSGSGSSSRSSSSSGGGGGGGGSHGSSGGGGGSSSSSSGGGGGGSSSASSGGGGRPR